jgi:2-methylaconitate cis-trans-isomerase PrpF
MQHPIPCTIMRGGTSRGVFFKAHDLPADIADQDRVIMVVFGSPDPYGRQIDGLGGATSTTSKVAIISPRVGEPNTVEYTFGQVSITYALVDRKGNCGNISSAVGPYAIDEGMVEIQEPVTTVRIYNTNTKKYIIARVAVEGGKAKVEGDHYIAGVPGTGASISLGFEQPGGAVSGRLLPTGRPRDMLQTKIGAVEVSIVDAANPLVFVRAQDLGLKGWELPVAVDSDPDLLARIESVRAAAAAKIGLVGDPAEATRSSPAVPKIAFVSPATEYTMTSGMKMLASDIDLVTRIMSMGKLHSSYAITGAICTAGAAKIAGTLVYDMIASERHAASEVRLGHPSGAVTVDVELETGTPESRYVCATVYRTARRIMDGVVYVPESLFGS